jgi:hypothetical protein
MWRFWPKAGPTLLTEPVRRELAKERGVSVERAGGLRMLTERGTYVDQAVTYFLVFNPTPVVGTSAEPRRYADLDPRLILHSGHIERDGAVVLNWQPHAPSRGPEDGQRR